VRLSSTNQADDTQQPIPTTPGYPSLGSEGKLSGGTGVEVIPPCVRIVLVENGIARFRLGRRRS
jgi:hypothetical protein